jgi:hypothetical protein
VRQAKAIVAPSASKPKKLGKKAILFNAAAGVVMVVGAYTGVRTFVFPPQTETCTGRYERSTILALDAGGKPLSAADFQGASNGRDAGVLENLSIRSETDGSVKTSMVVKFDERSHKPDVHGLANGGIAFPWQSKLFHGRQAACLSYKIFVPADFKFGEGGTLPGFASLAEGEALEAKAGFEIRPVWTGGGGVNLSVYVNSADTDFPNFLQKREYALPKDRWIRVDQELVLNAPEQSNGINRLWVDGQLIAEETSTFMRRTANVRISNVAVDIHFSGRGFGGLSPQNQVLKISPIEMRWK